MQDASLDIWGTKYQLKPKNGEPVDQSMSDTYDRVAKALSEVENEKIRSKIHKDFKLGLGKWGHSSGSNYFKRRAEQHKPATSTINCTVSGTVFDSMDDILQKNHEAGLTLKAGCGIGYEFSTLRPKGAYVAGAGATTSGPLSFMDILIKCVSPFHRLVGGEVPKWQHLMCITGCSRLHSSKKRGWTPSAIQSVIADYGGFHQSCQDDTDWHLSFPVTIKEAETMDVDFARTPGYVYREFPVHNGYVTNAEGLVACKIYRTVKVSLYLGLYHDVHL